MHIESGDIIKNVSKFKVENSVLIPLILFSIVSVISISCTRSRMGVDFQTYWMKQIVWYVIGFGLAYFMMFLGNKFLYNNAWWFYIVGVISLLLVSNKIYW